ncbi:MAG: HAMP domain-containing protein [Spirochaetes bacterium]|nr:HAMP domain-containing protein [Spirochaetota bacterium]
MPEIAIIKQTAKRLRITLIAIPLFAFLIHFTITPLLFGRLSSSPILVIYYVILFAVTLSINFHFIRKWERGGRVPLGIIYIRVLLAGVFLVGIGSQVALLLDGTISLQVIAIRFFWMFAIAALIYFLSIVGFMYSVRGMPAMYLSGDLRIPLRDKLLSIVFFTFLVSMTIVNVIHYRTEMRIIAHQQQILMAGQVSRLERIVNRGINAFTAHARHNAETAAALIGTKAGSTRAGFEKALSSGISPLFEAVEDISVTAAGVLLAPAAQKNSEASVAWESSGGNIFLRTPDMTWYDHPAYRQAEASGGTAVAASNGVLMIAAPIMHQGFAGAFITIVDVRTVAARTAALPLPRNSRITVSIGGTVIAANTAAQTGVQTTALYDANVMGIVTNKTHGENELNSGDAKFDGKPGIAFASIGPKGILMTVITMPKTSLHATAEIDNAARLTAFTLWITIMIVGTVIIIALNIFLKPLERAGALAKELSAGRGDLTKRIAVGSNDEIGALVHHFNKFIDKMDFIIAGIKGGTSGLNANLRSMHQAMQETSTSAAEEIESIELTVASVEQIMSSINQVSGVTQQQKNAFASANVAIEELLKSIIKISDHMQKQAVAISETSSAIEEMTSNILSVAKNVGNADAYSKRLLAEAKAGGEKVEDLVDAIHEIEESSAQINEIISVIQGIAEQTDLLAMNAAIEAAHAGDQGKGFAVVADEIRKLAENTAENSKSITVIVKEIGTRIERTVSLAVGSGRSLEDILEVSGSTANIISEINASNNELEVGGRDILETIKNLNEITGEVKASVEEQMQSGNVVESQVTLLDRITSEVANAIGENAIGAKEITSAMERLNAIAHKNRESSSMLASSIEELNSNFTQFLGSVNAFRTTKDTEKPAIEGDTVGAQRMLPTPESGDTEQH